MDRVKGMVWFYHSDQNSLWNESAGRQIRRAHCACARHFGRWRRPGKKTDGPREASPRSSPQNGASAAALRFSDHDPPLHRMTGGAERTSSPVQQPQEPTERQRRGAPQRFYGRCPFWLFRPLLMTWTAHPADGRRNLAEGCETSMRSGGVTSGFPLTGRAWTPQETEQGRKPPSVFWSSPEGSRRPEFPSHAPQLAPQVPEQEERRLRRLLCSCGDVTTRTLRKKPKTAKCSEYCRQLMSGPGSSCGWETAGREDAPLDSISCCVKLEEEGTGRKTLDSNKDDPGKHTQKGGKNISKTIHSEEIGTKQNPLNCMLANARSLTNKMEELEAEISTGNFDIVGITETWLDESYDWAVNLQGYSLFRKDRKNRRGGGVCLYVKSCLKSTLREDISEGNEDVESIWVEIHGGKNGNKILIGVCYKPPNITESMESLLLKQIDEAATHNEVLVMGDFNYPDINWETETCETHKGNRDSIATGSVPQDWRIANVVPIFKKGSKSEPGNYRPFHFCVTYIPGTKNVKADAKGVVVAALGSELESSIQEAQNAAPTNTPHGRHPSFDPFSKFGSAVPEEESFSGNLDRIWTNVRHNLKEANRRSKKYFDKKRREALFAVGDVVWLSSRNLRLKIPSKKLRPKYVGPFKDVQVLNLAAVRLDIPLSWRINSVFLLSLLKKVDTPDKEPMTTVPPVDEDGEFEISRILDSRWHRGSLQYLVSWKGFGPEDNSWVKAEDVSASRLIKAFHRRFPNKAQPR
ncbi:unnamed protein product [Ranitomeya imitator]|uniref:Chromo domain-containing protein n=1 Tax=Ranitomeya imitator TaxID=111125 RepID=A0ABN9LRZ5_9NEOB|nr:unnamed protein product [Ranitomeya imitator]